MLAPGFIGYARPDLLPGSRTLLFHAWRSSDPERSEILALDLVTGQRTSVLTNAMDPRYVDTDFPTRPKCAVLVVPGLHCLFAGR
jgi:hypothetical protein